jgi:hypothetical protein
MKTINIARWIALLVGVMLAACEPASVDLSEVVTQDETVVNTDDGAGVNPGPLDQTAEIGAAGGSVSVALIDGGVAVLDIPSGALAIDIPITLAAFESVRGNPAITISPAGFPLNRSARLTITTVAQGTFNQGSMLILNPDSQSIPLESTVREDGRSLVAELSSLGLAQPDSLEAAKYLPPTGEAGMETAAFEVQLNLQCSQLEAQAGLLLADHRSAEEFRTAIPVFLALQATYGRQDCPGSNFPAVTLEQACSGYTAAVNDLVAAQDTHRAPEEFFRQLERVFPWYEAMRIVQHERNSKQGIPAGDCGSDFFDNMNAASLGYLGEFTDALTPVTADNFSRTKDMFSRAMLEFAEFYGEHPYLRDWQAEVSQLVIRPLSNQLRLAAYQLARELNETRFLQVLSTEGMLLPADIRGVPPITEALEIGYTSAYSDERLFSDVHLVRSSLRISSLDASGNVVDVLELGGAPSASAVDPATAPQHVRDGRLYIRPGGRLTLSGDVRSLTCFDGAFVNGQYADAQDQLLVRFSDDDITTVESQSVAANFFQNSRTLYVDDLFSETQQTLVPEFDYRLTIVRDRSASTNSFCLDHLMGPSVYPLFDVTLSTEPQDFSVVAKLPGEPDSSLINALTIPRGGAAEVHGIVLAAQQPVVGQLVQFTASPSGTISASASTDSNGHAIVTYQAEPTTCGLVTIEATTGALPGLQAAMAVTVDCQQTPNVVLRSFGISINTAVNHFEEGDRASVSLGAGDTTLPFVYSDSRSWSGDAVYPGDTTSGTASTMVSIDVSAPTSGQELHLHIQSSHDTFSQYNDAPPQEQRGSGASPSSDLTWNSTLEVKDHPVDFGLSMSLSAGSSSCGAQLYDVSARQVLAEGFAEEGGTFSQAFGGVLGSGTYRLSAYCDIGVSGSWHTPTQAHQGSLDVTLSLTSQQGNTYR